MAQIDDLMSVLSAIHDDVTNVLARAKSLEDQLNQLQQTTPPQVDLQPAIDAATQIRQSLEGTASTTGSATGADTSGSSTSDTSGSTSDTSGAAASTGSTDGSAGAVTDPAAGTGTTDTSSGAAATDPAAPPADGSQSADVQP